jgi:hypothetical protein
MDWQRVYDLRQDHDYVAAVQKATLTTDEFGIEPTNGLFASPEWWRRVESGDLPMQTPKGKVTRVFMGSMGDWPEFEMQGHDGSLVIFTRYQNAPDGSADHLYVVGGEIEVDFVWQQFRQKAPEWGLPKEQRSVIAIRIAADEST